VRQLDRPANPFPSAPHTPDREASPASPDTPDNPVDPISSPGLFQATPISIRGPALPSDDEDQIYDNFSGELAYNRPHFDADDDEWPESDEDDPENIPHFSNDRAILDSHESPTPLPDFPESDGLLMEHGNTFDSAQQGVFACA
jgi:hypothetical protein